LRAKGAKIFLFVGFVKFVVLLLFLVALVSWW